ncbi:co-chaperone GroES [Natronosporangium hydrolyticum]|uniref:10 kDa chaperonin n=1 Tax=Natronosporangium hydrolyticum TaxID=2811111 RepID=A0A895YBH2_9ACTN|nr:co-chaperone GroES [Natronosporangium hydrolyticum]
MFCRACSNRPTATPLVSPRTPYGSQRRLPGTVWTVTAAPETDTGLPIRLLHDRVLVRVEGAEGERRSTAGIVIPATASMGRRLAWATVVGVGPHVRAIVTGDRVLFDPEDRSEVELHGQEYILLRERDVHAVAAQRVQPDATGLYL